MGVTCEAQTLGDTLERGECGEKMRVGSGEIVRRINRVDVHAERDTSREEAHGAKACSGACSWFRARLEILARPMRD